MKKIIFITIALAAVAACSKTEEAEQSASNENAISIVGKIGDPSTKTVYDEASDGTMSVTWKAGDKIGVYCTINGSYTATNLEYTADESSGTTTFSPVGNGLTWSDETSTHNFFAYYPYDASAGSSKSWSIPSVQTQSEADNNEHLAENDLLACGYFSKTQTEDPLTFSFSHLFSFLEIRLIGAEGGEVVNSVTASLADDYTLAASGTMTPMYGTINTSTVTDVSNRIKVNLTTPATLSATASSSFYMVIYPGHGGETLTISANVNDQDVELGTLTIPSGGIPASVNAVTPVLTVTAPSAVEEKEGDLSSSECANTYIVTAAGDYCFNANVKGTGNVPSGYETVESSTSITPGSALVLWYNCQQTGSSFVNSSPVDVNSLSIDSDGYIHFTVPSDPVAGNVVIAAFAESGLTYDSITATDNQIDNATLLWSWNIWVVPDYDAESSAITVGSFKLMDRNLGALIGAGELLGTLANDDNAIYNASAIGNFYQWGRKDPFPYYGSAYVGTTYHTTPTFTPITALQKSAYGLTGLMFGDTPSDFTITPETATASGYDMATIQDYVDSHPYIYLQGNQYSNGYGWFSATGNYYKSLWGDRNSDDSGTISEKSMYDPCPAGWRLWTAAEYDAVIDAGSSEAVKDATGYGIDMLGTYFAMNGDGRAYDFKARTVVRIKGRFYTASCTTYSGAWLKALVWQNPDSGTLSFAKNSETSSGDGGGSIGASVRCVKE
jgi:hypothetical protein